MKEETPTFYLHDPTTKRTTLDLPPFLNYLQTLTNPDFNKHQTNIQEHLHLLSKTYDNQQQVLQVVRFLCHTFNATNAPVALQLLRTVIGADLKYQASSQGNSSSMVEENVKMADNNQVIALPYAPPTNDASPSNTVPYGPQLPSTIALHAVEPMSDVCDQRKHNDSKNYYAQDNQVVVEYLKDKFIIVKREGISAIFGKASEVICLQLIDKRLQQFQKLVPSVLLEVLKLLEYITPPLYTFYLLHLTQKIVQKVCSIFSHKETEKRASKVDAQGIIYTLKYIADRWAESQQSNVQNMEWVLQTHVISLFIHSPVSQKKLYAVKLLCQICRKCQYSASAVSRETIETFISEKGLLQEIYRADNHPEVISKGEEVFLFLVKEDRLNENYINVIFNLLEKCHEHLSKSLFATLQRVGHQNIENQRRHLLKRIEQLPRATCFNEETFNLIETIMISTPSSEAEANLEALYRIMQKNYDKLKEVLKGRAVTVYYEVFIMGIEQGVFDHLNAMVTLKPILHNPNSTLFSFMIENFIFRLKEQYSKQIGLKCKKTLHSAIRMLIAEEQIHKMPVNDQKKHLKILNLLLENYEQLDQKLLSSEDLWVLIKMDRQFSKYLKFYPQDVQVSLISHLISSETKSPYDIECIIDLYQLMGSEVKAVLAPLLYDDYFKSHHLFSKYLLARHILDIQPIAIDEAVKKLEESRSDLYLALSWVILIRQIINKEDQKGFGKYPPFEDLRNSFELTVKVINNIDVFQPIQSEIKVKNYLTVHEITRLALRGEDVSFQKMKLKLNDQLLTLNQLKQKVYNLTTYRNITLDINETIDCQWFNKDILFDKDGAFKNEIVDILKQVFNKYASRDGKLRPGMVAKIFQKATDAEIIAENDHRVIYIFNNYSNNGDYITSDEWINFYYQSSIKNAPLVIDNLKKLGYSSQLKTQVNFELLFKQNNVLREYLSADGKIYQVLFKSFQSLIENSPIQLHGEILKEFTTTLKLLPVSAHIITCLQEMNQYLFDFTTNNTLYYWYLSTLLESVYFKSIEIGDYTTWKDTFERTSICQSFLTIYENYLYKVLSNGPNRYQVNIDLQIFIMESLGKVVRRKFTEIPSLLDQKYQFVPCMIRSSFIHIDDSILSLIAELGLLSINICKGKRDQQIVENAVAIVLDMALSSNINIKIPVIEPLIFSEILTVRQIFNTFYYLLSSAHPEVKKDYYNIHISRNSKSNYRNCQEYFNVLNKLLFTEEDDRYFQEISTVYQKELSQEKYIDNLSESTETDQILLGKLKILNEIKLYNPQTQINMSTISSIKDMLENSLAEQVREILYTMTNNICDIEYSLQLMIKIMEQTNLKRNSIHRGKKKMGIMNLGCICYINAVLQQLEMIEPFRKGIIGTEVVGDAIDFFREFQHIIYQLTFGQRIFLIPESFCLNYLDSNNMPINIREQHDADEFLNQLLDRLEFRLKDTNQGHLINNSFKGELVNVINCQKCYHKKQKIQNFYILSVEIKNQNNLKDCLSKLIEPEIICDYFCDFCEGKVQTIQKYNRFHSLPPFLFIHLQRLVFDLETFTKIKLDHPVSFPTQINLQDYFEQEADQQLYILKGFVVHLGSSEGGHYYSIIKCENGWIKFDDTRIDDWDWTRESHDKDHAYLLIYQKKWQGSELISQQISIGNPTIMKIVQDDINFLMKEKIFLQPSFTKYLINTMKKIHIPDQFLSSPNQPNHPYQHNHSQLPKDIQQKLDLAYEAIMHYIKLQTEMREMRINSSCNDMGENEGVVNKEGSELPSIVYYLVCILHIRPTFAFSAAQHFIKEGAGNFLEHIYLHRDKVIREAFKMIVFKVAMIITAVDKETSFLLPIPQNQVINRLLQKVMVGLNEVGKNPLKMCQYFAMLLDLCKIDNRFVAWFQANKLGPRLIHFYMQKDSGLENLLPAYPYYMNSDRRVESIALMFEVLSLLVNYEPDLCLQKEETLLERKAYLNIDLYRKLLNDRYANESITNIFKYAARNERMNDKIITLVVENLNRFNHDDEYIYVYIHIMYGLLTIEDTLSGRRLQRFFGVPILTVVGENDEDKYLARNPTDRVCKYWNPCFKPGDEIIFSFLELLYTNRSHHTYFTLLGVICLLKLITTNKEVNRYIQQLPGPCRDSKSYLDWMQQFVFNFEKSANLDNNGRMSQQQKHTFLQQIVKYLRDVEINQEKSNDEDAKPYLMHLSRNKQQYYIDIVKDYSKWEEVQFQFFENLLIYNNENIEQIANVSPRDILCIKYRLAYCNDAEEMSNCAKVIEYQIDIMQKSKIYFTESYDYTLYFETGFYQLSLPFANNQLPALRVELLQEVTVKARVQERQSERMAQEPIIREDVQGEALMSRREVDDFPSISDVYDQKYQSTHAENQIRNQRNEERGGVEIECPFCSFKATSFSSKCPNCQEEWGQMGW